MENKSPKKIEPNYPRIITAMLIVASVLAAISLGNNFIAILFLLINIFGARELCYILEKKSTLYLNILYTILAILPFVLLYFLGLNSDGLYEFLIAFSALIMLILIANLWLDKINFGKIRFPFTIFYWGLPLSLAAYLLTVTERDYQITVLGIVTLIWTSDTMAYFTGKAIGKNKLFPSVSPGKTIEGSLGAGVFCVLIGFGFSIATSESFLKWVFLAVAVWILGTLGDLVESKLKRVQKVKDSGSILPGHGGFLDRFDSLVLLIPFLLMLEYYMRS